MRARTFSIRAASAAVVIVSTIWLGAWQMDTRYVRADYLDRQMGYMQEQIGGLTVLYLESELRALRRQLFELMVAKQRRQLTRLEIQRMAEVEREIRRLEIKVARMRDKRT